MWPTLFAAGHIGIAKRSCYGILLVCHTRVVCRKVVASHLVTANKKQRQLVLQMAEE